MFEKEAKEYAIENTSYYGTDDCYGKDTEKVEQTFKKGAEFGYNKANEWNFVKDGKYPTHENKVICILGDFENENLEVGHYSQDKSKSKRWRFEDYDLPDDSENDWGVSAWKEIVLPRPTGVNYDR